MKIFLKVREEYEYALMRSEEVVAGIPAYVPSSSFLSLFFLCSAGVIWTLSQIMRGSF
jgi:hypothetical protein